MQIIDTTRHDWLISVRFGNDLATHVLTAPQTSSPDAIRSALDFAIANGAGQEMFIGMRALDTDPIL